MFKKHIVIFSLKHKMFVTDVTGYCFNELDAKRFDSEADALAWLEPRYMHMDIGHFHTRVFYTVS